MQDTIIELIEVVLAEIKGQLKALKPVESIERTEILLKLGNLK